MCRAVRPGDREGDHIRTASGTATNGVHIRCGDTQCIQCTQCTAPIISYVALPHGAAQYTARSWQELVATPIRLVFFFSLLCCQVGAI